MKLEFCENILNFFNNVKFHIAYLYNYINLRYSIYLVFLYPFSSYLQPVVCENGTEQWLTSLNVAISSALKLQLDNAIDLRRPVTHKSSGHASRHASREQADESDKPADISRKPSIQNSGLYLICNVYLSQNSGLYLICNVYLDMIGVL